MRDYSKVSSQFWTGKTGRSLRGDLQTQVVALYLMTSQHANMIGVFHCPIVYIAHETGSSLEGASKALKKLQEGGFCTYYEDCEVVFVHEMAKFQIAEALKATDNRVKDIQKQFESLPETRMKHDFFARYGKVFNLVFDEQNISPFEAPSKPVAVAVAVAVAVTEKEKREAISTDEGEKPATVTTKPTTRSQGSRLPLGWQPSFENIEYARQNRPDLDPQDIVENFRDYWTAKSGKDGTKVDWDATWRMWVRNEKSRPAGQTGGTVTPNTAWWASASAMEAKARTLGLNSRPGESLVEFKGRIENEIRKQQGSVRA